MAHFAEIKSSNNTVLRVVVINDSDVSDNGGEYTTESENWVSNFIPNDPFILEDNGGNYPTTYWKQTSYNANARGIYAGIGYTYHADVDEFRHPQPFNSWTWDSTDKIWSPPNICSDTTEGATFWDEENQRWKNGEGTKYWDGSAWQNV